MKQKKTFDAVRFMRKARERLGREFENLSYAEQRARMEQMQKTSRPADNSTSTSHDGKST
jgi:hypothetical protein